MYLYFDTEFTSLVQNTTLISIGIVSQDNKKFYAEFTDYDKNLVRSDKSGFLKNEILSRLKLKSSSDEKFDSDDTRVLGDTKRIANELLTWMLQFTDVQFVADVMHYDFVLLCQLYGGAMSLPKFVSPSCIELNTLLGKYFNISDREAFDLNREEIAGFEGVPDKHNSLFDAKICKIICDKYKLLN